MSRVERIENANERKRQADRGPRVRENRRTDSPGRTPGMAEGEERDVEAALRRRSE